MARHFETVTRVNVVGWFPNHSLKADLTCGCPKWLPADAPVEVGDIMECVNPNHTDNVSILTRLGLYKGAN